MADSSSIGRLLLILGLALAAVGLLVMLAGRIPFLGRLPGDISIQRDGWSFHFPLATSIVISLILTVILNLILRR